MAQTVIHSGFVTRFEQRFQRTWFAWISEVISRSCSLLQDPKQGAVASAPFRVNSSPNSLPALDLLSAGRLVCRRTVPIGLQYAFCGVMLDGSGVAPAAGHFNALHRILTARRHSFTGLAGASRHVLVEHAVVDGFQLFTGAMTVMFWRPEAILIASNNSFFGFALSKHK